MSRPALFAWSLAAMAAYASLLNVCALLFSCGCRSWWTGAATACNIHRAGVRHCPWCVLEPTWFWGMFGVFVIVEGWIVYRLRGRPLLVRFAGALAGYGLAAGFSAGLSGWWMGYWAR